MKSRLRNNKAFGLSRRAAATVEFAVCLPVVFLVVFGSIQAASMLFLRQAAIQAAYEGVKVAIREEGTDDRVRAAAQAVIDGRRLTGVTIDIQPNNANLLDAGTIVDVTVTVPSDENTLFPFDFFAGRVVSGNAVMVKE
jgi:Flp pilus assembly protein TadG